MAIAITLNEYLDKNEISYDLVKHHKTVSSFDSSRAAHIPVDQVGKAIVLQNKAGEHLMAVLPADHRLSLTQVNQATNQEYHVVNESKLKDFFPDCERGAIPAVGDAYNMQMIVDDVLFKADWVYIEAGDHQNLIRIDRKQFVEMMSEQTHGDILGKLIGVPKLEHQHLRDWAF